jgi:hypothetical protein
MLRSTRDSEPEGSDESESFASRSRAADEFEREKQEAIAEPGPPWKEWFLFSGAKTWVVLGFFIIDSWIVASWLSPPNLLAMGLSLAGAIYVEFLLYSYLWERWNPERGARATKPFHPNFRRLREVGRWTPEGSRAKRDGKTPQQSTGGPRREEFM